MKKLFPLFLLLLLIGCASKVPVQSQSATILIKTPKMKFYDKGFITKYKNYTQVQIYSAGQIVLDLSLYNNQICQSTFECLDSKSFNAKYLHPSYESNFLKELFDQEKTQIVHRNKAQGILIKIKKDSL